MTVWVLNWFSWLIFFLNLVLFSQFKSSHFFLLLLSLLLNFLVPKWLIFELLKRRNVLIIFQANFMEVDCLLES